jgi:branched-chain amino acid transport system substrate-binding protein
VVPWQPWFFGRKGDPAKGFEWTNHIFWGLEDVITNYTNGWNSVTTNKKVGGLFPNDGDGNAWGDPNLGFPKPLAGMGYALTDPGRFPERHAGFFGADLGFQGGPAATSSPGVVIPPDAKTFLTRRGNRVIGRRSSPSARRCCSRAPSKHSAILATA